MVCLKCSGSRDCRVLERRGHPPPFDGRNNCRSVRFLKVRRTGKTEELMVADGILFQKRAEGCRSRAGLGINDDMVREAGRVVCRRALDLGSRVGLALKEKGMTVHSFQMHEKSGGKAALGIAFDGRVMKGNKGRCLTRSRSWRAIWIPMGEYGK